MEFDQRLFGFVSESTAKAMKVFPQLIASQEGMLRGYHSHTSTVIGERPEDLLESLKISARHIHTMMLAKSVFYGRAVIETVNSGNLLVAFQSLRALVEVIAAVKYTLEKAEPIVHEAATARQLTLDQAKKLNYQFDLLLHGGRFNWQTFFLEGAWAVLEKKNKQRSKQEKQQFAATNALHLRIATCITAWAKKEPIAEFVYDYLSDLVHPNKGSNLVVLVEGPNGPTFYIEGRATLGLSIFDKIFPVAVSLCNRQIPRMVMILGLMGAEEHQLPDDEFWTRASAHN
jgi:hypothetical protein